MTHAPPTIPGVSGSGKIYPTPTSRLGRAWAHAWRELVSLPPGEFVDGTELADRAARKVVPFLATVTMTSLFIRMARAGLLIRETRSVVGRRGPRPRSFYRIPTDAEKEVTEP